MFTPFKTAVFAILAIASMTTLAFAAPQSSYATSGSHTAHVKTTNAKKASTTPAQPVKTEPKKTDETQKSVQPTTEKATTTSIKTSTPQPNTVPCVDGTIKANLVVTKLAKNTYSVTTKNKAPLCADVTLYLSSYILPDNYDGSGFGGPTSYPQQIFDSTKFVIKKGDCGTVVMTVKLPEDKCKSIQVDVYYAPEVTVVGQGGHGKQFIAGELYKGTGDCQPKNCDHQPPVTPPVIPPVTPPTPPVVTPPAVTPPAPITPVVHTTPVVQAEAVELPETGSAQSPFIILAVAAGVIAYMVAYVLQPKKVRN